MNGLSGGTALAGEALQRLLASLIDASPHALLIADRDGRILHASAELSRWLGASGESVAGGNVTELLAGLGSEGPACWRRIEARIAADGVCRDVAARLQSQGEAEAREVLVNAAGLILDGDPRAVTAIASIWRDVTAERRAGREARTAGDTQRTAEEAAREAETRFRTLFDSARDCIFIKDRSLTYTAVNAAMGRLFNLPPGEILGRTDAELFGPASAEETAEYDRRVLAGETLELEHTKPVRGVLHSFHVIKVPMRTETGAVCGLCGIARDVTQRRRVMEGLQVREAILGAVAFAAERFLGEPDLAPLPQVLARLGRAAQVSRVYVCAHAEAGDGTRGPGPVAAWESPEFDACARDRGEGRFCGQQAGLQSWGPILERGEVVRGHAADLPAPEREVLQARGVVSVIAVPIFEGDRWWGAIGFDECSRPREWQPAEVDALRAAADIIGAAVQRQAAARQIAVCGDFEHLLASIAADFITMRPEQIGAGIERALEGIGRFTGARRCRVYTIVAQGTRASNPHGWTAEPGLARRSGDFDVPPEVFSGAWAPLTRGECLVIARPSDWSPEAARVASLIDDDGFRPMVLAPMLSAGVLLGVLVVAGAPGSSHTWPAGALPHLQFAAQVIGSAIARRDAEGRLRQEREEFERLAQGRQARIRELERQRAEDEKLAATGRVATRIAHEINNPLAGIKNAFLLVKDCVPPDYRYYEYVGRIEREIDRIARIVRQMLDLHRPETEAARRFSAREAIEDVRALLAGDCRRAEATLAVVLDPGPLEVRLPRGAFVQVLYNIVANALDASPRGGEVRVAARLRAGRLHIRVYDRGAGIPSEISAHIFEPFFTTKGGAAGRGVGLGLPISRSLVDTMGGNLWFRSRPGRGTLFHVDLPASDGSMEVQRD